MNKKLKEEQFVDILKRVAKRVEETTVDISGMKSDLKMVSLRLGGVEHNTDIMKIDMEKMKIDVESVKAELGKTRNQLEEAENRLGKRITNVADLITISLDQKFGKMEKRVKKLEASSGINN